MVSLTRDIEELFFELKAKEPQPITDPLVEVKNKNGVLHKKYPSGWKYKRIVDDQQFKDIEQGGVYVFWWLKNSDECLNPFFSPDCERKYKLQGKKAWLSKYQGHIPLYVGKSADSILKRMLLHLQINKKNIWGNRLQISYAEGLKGYLKITPIPQI